MTLPPDPGPLPEGATPRERESHRRATERFLTEAGQHVAATQGAADATDRRLLDLRREHTKFMELHSPMRASLWLALQLPTRQVIHRAEMMRRFRDGQRSAGDAQLDETPAIIDIGNQMVAAALSGDISAIERISERIEGRVGLRQGDTDPEDPKLRRQAQDITERVVRAMNERRLAPSSPTKIIDVEASPAVDTKDKQEDKVAELPLVPETQTP